MSYMEIAAAALDEWEQSEGVEEAETQDFDLGATMSKMKRGVTGAFKDFASGAGKAGIGNGGVQGAMVDLAKHDAARHGGHFDPTKGTCKFREDMAKTLNSMGMLNGQNPEMEAKIKQMIGENNLKAGAQQSGQAQKNGEVDKELAEIQNLVKERKWEKDPEKKAKIQADLEAKRDAYYRRNMRDSEYEAMKKLEAKAEESPETAEKVVAVAQKITENPEADEVSKDAARAVIEKAMPKTPAELTKAQKERQARENAVQEAIRRAGTAEATAARAKEALTAGVEAAEEKFKQNGNETERYKAIQKARKQHFEQMKQAYMQKVPGKFVRTAQKLSAFGDGVISWMGDSGLCKVRKVGDKFYAVDANGNAQSEPMTAEEAVVYSAEHYDQITKDTTPEEHWKVCKANPKSNCPFLKQHRAELPSEARQEVFGDSPLMEKAQLMRGKTQSEVNFTPEQALAMTETIAETFGEENVGKVWQRCIDKVTDPRQADDPSERERIVDEVATELDAEGVSPEELNDIGEGEANGEGEAGNSNPTNQNGGEQGVNTAEPQGRMRPDGLMEYDIDGKTYVDISGRKYDKALWDTIGRIAQEGDKDIITDWDKMSGRWDEMKKRIPPAQQQQMQDLQDATLEAFDEMEAFNEAFANKSLSAVDRGYIKSLYRAWKAAKEEQKPKFLKELGKFMESKGLAEDGGQEKGFSVQGVNHKNGDVLRGGVGSWTTATDAGVELDDVKAEQGVPDKVEEKKNALSEVASQIEGKSISVGIEPHTTYTNLTFNVDSTPATWKINEIRDSFLRKMKHEMGYTESQYNNLAQSIDVSYDGVDKKIIVRMNNSTPTTIPFKDFVKDEHYQKVIDKYKTGIVIPLGNDEYGNQTYLRLSSSGGNAMPHLTIAGKTGSGKGMSARAIIGAIMANYSPNRVKLAIVDPKMAGGLSADYGATNGSKFMIHDVIGANNFATLADWMRKEHDNRMAVITKAGYANIDDYNKAMAGRVDSNGNPLALPDIVLPIDEISNLMKQNGKSGTGTSIEDLAEIARSSGIHLLMMTQRPDSQTFTPKMLSAAPDIICHQLENNSDATISILRGMKVKGQTGRGSFVFRGPYIDSDGNEHRTNGEGMSGQAVTIGQNDLKKLAEYNGTGTHSSNTPNGGGNGGGGAGRGNGTSAVAGAPQTTPKYVVTPEKDMRSNLQFSISNIKQDHANLTHDEAMGHLDTVYNHLLGQCADDAAKTALTEMYNREKVDLQNDTSTPWKAGTQTATPAQPAKVLSASDQRTVSSLERQLNRPGATASQKAAYQTMINRIKGTSQNGGQGNQNENAHNASGGATQSVQTQTANDIINGLEGLARGISTASNNRLKEKGRSVDFRKGGEGANLFAQQHPDWKVVDNPDGTVHYEPPMQGGAQSVQTQTANSDSDDITELEKKMNAPGISESMKRLYQNLINLKRINRR